MDRVLHAKKRLKPDPVAYPSVPLTPHRYKHLTNSSPNPAMHAPELS